MENSILNFVLDLLKISVPAGIVAATVVYLLRNERQKENEKKLIELKYGTAKELVILRLQAYERLALFLERISPYPVIQRVLEPDMISQELQYAMVRSINAEFEHNLSQQIYVSAKCWELIVASKDETIKTINLIAQQLPGEISANEFSRRLITSIASVDAPLPTQQALNYLKAEAAELF
jgi:hypothetical protein